MDPYEVTKMIMIIFISLYFVLEIILNLNDIDNDTSNVILLKWSKGKLFIIPYVIGAIAGHLFLGTTNNAFEMSNSMFSVLILFGTVLISVGVSFIFSFKKTKLFMSFLLILGLLYGHFLWSMNYQN